MLIVIVLTFGRLKKSFVVFFVGLKHLVEPIGPSIRRAIFVPLPFLASGVRLFVNCVLIARRADISAGLKLIFFCKVIKLKDDLVHVGLLFRISLY